jgi:hypothetical protein
MARFLLAFAVAVALASGSRAQAPQWEALGRDLLLMTLPVQEVERTRWRELCAPGAELLNGFRHRRGPSTPADAPFTTPIADTLYSSAFVDLSSGPVRVTVPDAPGR